MSSFKSCQHEGLNVARLIEIMQISLVCVQTWICRTFNKSPPGTLGVLEISYMSLQSPVSFAVLCFDLLVDDTKGI